MRVEAGSIGPTAARALQQTGTARVIASFDRSVYLQVGRDIVCVADESLYDGPLNLLIRTAGRRRLWSDPGVAVGQRWTVCPDRLSQTDGSGIVIDLGSSSAWQPKPPPTRPPDRRLLDHSLDRLRKLAVARTPPDGLLKLVLDRTIEPAGAFERVAIVPLRALPRQAVAWLDNGDMQIVKSLNDLLGLGPGLTPSGDDMIAGLLVACHAIGRGPAALDLWHRLAPSAGRRTTPISLAHLSAAGEGLGAAPLHDLLEALIDHREDRLPKALDAVAGIGHCSGFDALGGLLVLFHAWMGGSDEQRAAA